MELNKTELACTQLGGCNVQRSEIRVSREAWTGHLGSDLTVAEKAKKEKIKRKGGGERVRE